MYRVIKGLNNNGVLALDMDANEEIIMLGSGVGFGRRTGERFEKPEGVKLYRLADHNKENPAIKIINGINPIFLEIAGQIIAAAEKRFQKVSSDILLPLADHIAFAVKRMEEGTELHNPLTEDIRTLFPEEYKTALEGRSIIEKNTGFTITEDEVGYITLHIHSGLSDEDVGQTMKITMLVRECISDIERGLDIKIDVESLSYNRLMSHIRYMLARHIKNEPITLDMEDYVKANYPRSYQLAGQICQKLGSQLGRPLARQETGCFGLHIERVYRDEMGII